MKLVAHRNAIKQAFKDRFTAMADEIDVHPGRFNLDELKKLSLKLPAIRITTMALGKPEPVGNGEVDRAVKCVAFIITGDKKDLPRDEAALNIIEDLINYLPKKTFDKPEGEDGHIGGLHLINDNDVGEAENLYSSNLGRNNVTIWGLSWTQTIRFGQDEYPTVNVPLELYVGRVPEIGSDHQDDYKKVEV